MKWLFGLVISLCVCSVNSFADEDGTPGRIYNLSETENLIIWRSVDGDSDGQFAYLPPKKSTPPGVDWDFAAVDPMTLTGQLVWYKCHAGTAHNLRYVYYNPANQAYVNMWYCIQNQGTPFGNSVTPVSPWPDYLFWVPETNPNVLPAEAFIPLEGAYDLP